MGKLYRFLFTLLVFLCGSQKGASSQDLRLFSIVSPDSGCNLSNTENVSIVIVNVGGPIANGNFDVTYILNGGTSVTENIVLPPVFNNGSLLTYTFSAPADLSIPATYSFKAYIDITGDIDRTNDTISNYIVVSDPLSVGGTTSGVATVCGGSNTGVISLTGFTGSVINWESSPDGTSWSSISNTAGSHTYTNISASTYYRAIVKSGSCPVDSSTTTQISVDQPSVGGSISGGTSVCPSDAGTLTLLGYTGSVQQWEESTDNGATWSVVSNTSDQLNYSNITTQTLYRALVKNGVCTDSYSVVDTLSVIPASFGGIAGSDTSVCAGTNNGVLNISNHTGVILQWESSIDGGVSWDTILNTSASLTFNNLSITTKYRALVESCAPSDYSSIVTVTVDTPPIGGLLSGDTTVCASLNSGTLSLTGYSGSIDQWEYSTDGGVSWNVISNTNSTYVFNNLDSTSLFRVLVSNGSCFDSYSDTVIVTVDSPSVGGVTSGGGDVCIDANSGSIQLGQHIGQVTGWESSSDNGLTWNAIANTGTSLSYNNLTDTTQYRVFVKNGSCSSDTSTVSQVNVSSISDAGILSASDSVCYGSVITLSLSGQYGNQLTWLASTDSLTWDSLAANVSSVSVLINDYMFYKAIVKSGVCAADTSPVKSIYISTITADVSNDTIINEGSSVTLNASGGDEYLWSPSAELSSSSVSNPVATPTSTTSFQVIVSNSLACSDTANVIVTIKDKQDTIVKIFKVPNLITPNGDGFNDSWVIDGMDQARSSVVIFNTNGELIFSAQPYLNDWDGQWKGNSVPDGTYYYILSGYDNLGSTISLKGNLTVISR